MITLVSQCEPHATAFGLPRYPQLHPGEFSLTFHPLQTVFSSFVTSTS